MRGGGFVTAGLPLGAWALLVIAVGLGLTLELTFYRARRRERRDGANGEERAGPLQGGP